MNFKFHPIALTELEDAISYYNHLNPSLSLEFLEEFYSSIQRILQFPYAWMKFSESCRRCLLTRFPYGIIYQFSDDTIIIIAVMQVNRKPNYWEKRI